MPLIHIDLEKSSFLAWLIIFIYGGAIVMLSLVLIFSFSLLKLLLFLCLFPLILIFAYKALVTQALRSNSDAIVKLAHWGKENHWQITYKNQKCVDVFLLPNSSFMGCFFLLRFKNKQKKIVHNILIAKDSIKIEEFKILARWWKSHEKNEIAL